jgi:hypothetical protein
MARAAEFRRYAVECLALAQRTPNPDDKFRLLQMADTWRALADQTQREPPVEVPPAKTG